MVMFFLGDENDGIFRGVCIEIYKTWYILNRIFSCDLKTLLIVLV